MGGEEYRKKNSKISIPNYSGMTYIFKEALGTFQSVRQIKILFTSPQLPSSCNSAQKEADEFPSVLAASKGKVTDGNNIGRLITRCLKYVPELLDEVVDTETYS